MVDNNVEEFFELDVGYKQQVGGDGVHPVHAYDVNRVLKCMSDMYTPLSHDVWWTILVLGAGCWCY